MERYFYDLHVHTCEVSRCAVSPAKDIAEYIASIGYTGFVVTDHFFNGNCGVDKSLPWEEKVTQYISGYEKAKKRGKELGIDVFFGWEYSADGDYITLGLSPEWLYAHPDVDKMKLTDYFDLVHEEGGYLIHAHPFLSNVHVQLYPGYEDAVEVINAGKTDFANNNARWYAESYGLCMVGGSDMHCINRPRTSGVALPRRAADIGDLISMLRAGKHTVLDLKH